MSELWDRLNADPRQHLRYPSEHMVRWLSGLGDVRGKTAVDIGCGHGRHMDVFENFGVQPVGFDISKESWEAEQIGDMTDLAFADDGEFDLALSFGVFYYGTLEDHRKAVAELHRVLKPGGHALVVIRTPRDSRAAGPYESAERTMVDGPEAGMLINFLSLDDIGRIYGLFRDIQIDTSEVTRDNGKWLDSDWLIRLVK